MTARSRSLLYAALLTVVYLLSLVYLGRGPLGAGRGVRGVEATPGGPLWSGFYTLAVPAEVSEARVLEGLEAVGASGVVTESGTVVRVSAFSHVELLPVGRIASRLEPEDPRRDPYVSRLPGFFRADSPTGSYRLYFLPAEEGIITTLYRLHRALSQSIDGWFLADFAGVHRWVAFGGLSLLVVILAVLARGRRLLMVAAGLPWVVGSLSVGGAWTALGGAVCVGAYLVAGSGRQARSVSVGAGVGAVALAAILAYQGSLVPVRAASIALLATVAVLGSAWFRRMVKHAGRDHQLFVSLRILRHSHVEEMQGLQRLLPLLPLLMIVGALLVALPRGRSIEVPVPRPTVSAGHSRADRAVTGGHDSELLSRLADLWHETRGDELPNLSDFLAHVAYQEGFVYGAGYEFPRPSSPLTLVEIREEDGRLVEGTRVAAVYDEEWLAQTLESVPVGSIEQLLVQQPISTGVVRTPLGGLYSGVSHLISYIAVLFVAYSPILIGVLILRLRGNRARGSRSMLGRLNHGLAPYLPQRGDSSI